VRRGRVATALAVLLAASPAAADEPAAPTPFARAAPPPANGFSLKVALGGDYRDLFGIPIYGGDARLALGGQIGAFAAYGAASLTLGKTQYGLGTTIIQLGGSIERRFDRVALGLVLTPSYLRVNRVTANAAFDSLGVGAAPFVSVDLVSSGGHTLYLAGSVDLDEYLVGSTSFMWGPTLSIGYREED
jgi:hypothetical protein